MAFKSSLLLLLAVTVTTSITEGLRQKTQPLSVILRLTLCCYLASGVAWVGVDWIPGTGLPG